MEIKCLIVVYSYHHGNTEKVANAFADILKAEVKNPDTFDPQDLQKYDLVGFGAGIDHGKHYAPVLKLAEDLPNVSNKKAFIFSTSGITGKKKTAADHAALRKILVSKGYTIVDEFNCKGLDTYGVLKYIGGLNKGRPNEEDLKEAEIFADKLRRYV
jgi:flavodoxin